MIIFFYGQNDFKARQKIKELKEKFYREVENSEHSLNSIDGANCDLAALANNLSSGSLFTQKRMTIIENLFNSHKPTLYPEVLNYLQENRLAESPDIVLFFDPSLFNDRGKTMKQVGDSPRPLNASEKPLFDFLSHQKFAQEYAPLSNSELISWLKAEAKENGSSLDSSAAQTLISLAGDDLWLLSHEIAKLAHYKRPEEIKIADVKKFVSGSIDENIFALTDAISQKNKGLAVKLLEDQAQLGIPLEYVLVMIRRQIRILKQLKQADLAGSSATEITTACKFHPFVVKKGLEQARRFMEADLEKMLKKLMDIDRANKIGSGDPQTLIDLLISEL
ncbi:MAG TPA: DNA polymerase III subunit delta [bacterium]|nr:DNA polymerase III subunit delta [bacterium]HPT29459.1 DNA polymerase III subunit delta [bacterium]